MNRSLKYVVLSLCLTAAGCSHLRPAVDKGSATTGPGLGQQTALTEAEEKKAKAILDEGWRLYGQRMLPEAADKAQEMLAKHPKSLLAPEALFLTARSRFDQGQADLALQSAQKLVGQFPQSERAALARKIMGDCHLARRDYIKAGQQYLEGLAAARGPDERELIRLPLSALIEENLTAGEIRILYRKYQPSDMAPTLGLKLARMELDAGNSDEAKKLLSELAKKYPQSAEFEIAGALLDSLSAKREAAAPTEPPRIGLLAPLSGKYSDYGQAVKDGVELAVGEYNLKAALKVKLFIEDTKGDMVEAARLASKLIDSSKVMGILGEVLSGPTIAAAAVANAKGVPILSPTAMEERIAGIGPYVFQLTQSTSWQGASLAAYAVKKLGLTSLAVFYPNESSAEAAAQAFRDQAAKEGGKVVVFQSYETGTTDFKEQIEKLKAAKIQALFIPAPPGDIVMIAPQLAYNQLKVQLLGHEAWADPKVLTQGEIYVEGAVLAALSPSSGLAQASQAFEIAYKKRYNKGPSKQAAQGYDAAKVLLEALRRNPATAEDLSTQLKSTGAFTKSGNGYISYGKSGAQPKAQFKTIRNKKVVELE
jgi:branched-chain amino acid transport system substrate-binding protein